MAVAGISKLDLKRQNRMQVIRLLRSSGPTSRIDIAREVGITKAAVTIITNEMIQHGILYEKGEQAPKGTKLSRGRKKILLDIDPAHKMDMGLVLDSGILSFGICTLHGDPVEKHTVPIAAGESAETLMELIQRIYKDLLYKNDLSPAHITGLGVCIAPEYWEALHIAASDGHPDWSGLRSMLEEFVSLPIAFSAVTEGAALAVCDYWHPEGVPDDLLLFRCGETFSCTPILSAEIRRGIHGKAALMPENTEERCLDEACRSLFSEERTPELWISAAGTPDRILPELRRSEGIPLDLSVQSALELFLLHRKQAVLDAVRLYDPGAVILMEGPSGPDALFTGLQNSLQAALSSENCPLFSCPITEGNLFLAGSAFATREFFLNRGGF